MGATAMTSNGGVVLPCSQCRQLNRAGFDHKANEGTCGKCGAPLPALTMPVAISSDADFQSLVSTSPVPVLVDYWAAWCGPCRMVAPELEKVAARAEGRFVVAKVDTEALQQTAAQQNIQSIPTLAVWSGGREVARTMGAQPAQAIEQFVLQAVSDQ